MRVHLSSKLKELYGSHNIFLFTINTPNVNDDNQNGKGQFDHYAFAQKEFLSSKKFKETILRDIERIHSDYLMYCNVLTVVVGFTIVITTYLITRVGENWENNFSPVLGIFFLALCCFFGLNFYISDYKWKINVTDDFHKFVTMNDAMEQ